MLKSGLLFERITNSMGVFQQTRRRLEDVFRLRLQETSSRCFQGVLIKTNIFVLVTRPQHFFKTFSRRLQNVFKVFCKNVFKTSSRRLQDILKTSSRRLQNFFKTSCKDFFSRRIILLIRLQKTSSRRLDQDQYIHLGHTPSTHFQDVFKTSSKRLEGVLQKRLQDIFKTTSRGFENVFKTSSRHLQDVFQICLQDVFKAYHQVKIFLLTRF